MFIQTDKNDPETCEKETMWCIRHEEGYKKNTPFIFEGVAYDDIIAAEWDADEEFYVCTGMLKSSGNSTLVVYFYDKDVIKETSNTLQAMGCGYEGFPQRQMINVNVPKEVDYPPIGNYLEAGEAEGKWSYGELCLCHEY